jgi:hypothetical protein
MLCSRNPLRLGSRSGIDRGLIGPDDAVAKDPNPIDCQFHHIAWLHPAVKLESAPASYRARAYQLSRIHCVIAGEKCDHLFKTPVHGCR